MIAAYNRKLLVTVRVRIKVSLAELHRRGMTIKKLLLPHGKDYPVELTGVFTTEGAFVGKGDKLYTLQTPSGRDILIRAPLDGIVAGIVWSVGDKLKAREHLLSLKPVTMVSPETIETATKPALNDDADIWDSSFSSLPEKSFSKPAAASNSNGDVEKLKPTPARLGKAEAAQESSWIASALSMGRFALGALLTVALSYIALHVVHSVPAAILADRLLYFAIMLLLPFAAAYLIGYLWLLTLPIRLVRILVTFLIGRTKGPRIGAMAGILLTVFSFQASLDTLKAYSQPLLAELIGHLTGGPVILQDKKLYVLGRRISISNHPQVERAWRLGPYGAVVDEMFIYNQEFSKLSLHDIASSSATDATGKVSYFCLTHSLESKISGRSKFQRYADHVILYSPNTAASVSSENGALIFVNSDGSVMYAENTEHVPSNGEADCEQSLDIFRVPER